eukprot:3309754-Prymnesium_polylepis.1
MPPKHRRLQQLPSLHPRPHRLPPVRCRVPRRRLEGPRRDSNMRSRHASAPSAWIGPTRTSSCPVATSASAWAVRSSCAHRACAQCAVPA